jgi:hypothetical protein
MGFDSAATTGVLHVTNTQAVNATKGINVRILLIVSPSIFLLEVKKLNEFNLSEL